MKFTLLLFSALTAGLVSCKTKQPAETTTVNSSTMEQTSSQTIGKVSHQYSATGCPTVVIVKKGEDVITLIPKDKLPAAIDVDGLEISFDYLPLRMPNPMGCSAGFPASLTNIKSLKK